MGAPGNNFKFSSSHITKKKKGGGGQIGEIHFIQPKIHWFGHVVNIKNYTGLLYFLELTLWSDGSCVYSTVPADESGARLSGHVGLAGHHFRLCCSESITDVTSSILSLGRGSQLSWPLGLLSVSFLSAVNSWLLGYSANFPGKPNDWKSVLGDCFCIPCLNVSHVRAHFITWK